MPGVPSNVPTIPPRSISGDSFFDNPSAGLLIFIVLAFLLVVSVMQALEGHLLISATAASVFAVSVLAIWWFKIRMRHDRPPADEQ